MSTSLNIEREEYVLEERENVLVIKPRGLWTIKHASQLDKDLTADLANLEHGSSDVAAFPFDSVIFDFEDLIKLDTAGAYILTKAIGAQEGLCRSFTVINTTRQGQENLIQATARASEGMKPLPPAPWYTPLSNLGEGVVNGLHESYDNLVFFGEFVVLSFKILFNPKRIRWKSVVSLIETVGLDALPIVCILSFFIGAVIAFMGSDLLASFGAKIFVVDLIGIAVMREFGVLITAVLLAARSNSAFTAQIGSMKMRQEVDAMSVIGLSTGDTLVAPRAIACLVSAPILTFFAILTGILGGMLVGWAEGVSPVLFSARLVDVVPVRHFWVGMVKSPVFALVVALIGCRQGLAVRGSVDSLGHRTTKSVVQAIFTIIVVDAVFAMFFLQIGV